jgi:hypothetical protein
MRGNIRFFYDNEWDKYTPTFSTEHPNWPATNTQQRWPGRSWRSQHGTNSGWGLFVITTSNNQFYYDEGGGQITITITPGNYNADTLSDEIESQLNSSGVSGACIYTVVYDDENNVFIVATDPSCVFELLTTNTTNAIWGTLGFDTSADTGFDSIHIADYIRIHTEEWIKIDAGVGNTIDWCAFMIKNDNIQSSGVIRIQFSDDDFVTTPFSQGLTKNTLGKNQRFNLFATTQTYRYARIYIQDIDNPDGYIEVGRAWGGCSFRPRIGFSPKYTLKPTDPSRMTESEGGQISTIDKPQFDTRDYQFDLVTGETLDNIRDFETMFDSRGTSKELWILEMPTSSSVNEFTDPHNNSYYCHFASYAGYKHMAGCAYSLKIRIQEER